MRADARGICPDGHASRVFEGTGFCLPDRGGDRVLPSPPSPPLVRRAPSHARPAPWFRPQSLTAAFLSAKEHLTKSLLR